MGERPVVSERTICQKLGTFIDPKLGSIKMRVKEVDHSICYSRPRWNDHNIKEN